MKTQPGVPTIAAHIVGITKTRKEDEWWIKLELYMNSSAALQYVYILKFGGLPKPTMKSVLRLHLLCIATI